MLFHWVLHDALPISCNTQCVEKDFHLWLWDRLLQQAKISLNLLRQSINLPHISDYTHIFGEFDFNHTTLAPPGTIVVIHNRPNDCASWEPHVEYGWYILTAIEHCRCHKVYTPKTRAELISDTVEFPPKTFHIPQMYSMGATYHAAQDLIYALQNPAPASPLVKLGHGH